MSDEKSRAGAPYFPPPDPIEAVLAAVNAVNRSDRGVVVRFTREKAANSSLERLTLVVEAPPPAPRVDRNPESAERVAWWMKELPT